MKSFKIELRWAILYSLAIMGWGMVEQKLGWHDVHISIQLVFHLLATIAIMTVVLIVMIKQKRTNYYKGKMEWKQGIVTGGKFAVITAALSVLTQYFIYHYISPDFFSHAIAYVTNKAHHPMSLKDAKEIFSMKSYIVQGIQDCFSFGLVLSAIVAFALKKTPEE